MTELTQAERRQQAVAVEHYLAELNSGNRTGGDMRSPDKIKTSIERMRARAADSELTYVQRLKAVAQLKRDEAALTEGGNAKGAFVSAAKEWGEENGIDYFSWRELGVPAAVLREAGILRVVVSVSALESTGPKRTRQVRPRTQCDHCEETYTSNNKSRHMAKHHPELAEA